MTDKTVFFLILAMGCLYLILDEFYGKKRIDGFISVVFNTKGGDQ